MRRRRREARRAARSSAIQQLGGPEALQLGGELRGAELRSARSARLRRLSHAMPTRLSLAARARASRQSRFASSRLASVSVPGVTMRATLRSTGPLLVAGSPNCSQIATDSPSFTSARDTARRVIRHARHRDRRAGRCAARGQRDVEQRAPRARRRRRTARRSRPSGRTRSLSGCSALTRRYCCIIGVCAPREAALDAGAASGRGVAVTLRL